MRDFSRKTLVLVCLLFNLGFLTDLLAEDPSLIQLIEQRQSALMQLQNSYWTQLLNRDLISAPQLEARVSGILYELDFLRSEASERGVADQLSPWPPLHSDVTSRLSFFRERAVQQIRGRLQGANPLPINFTTMTPAPRGLENRSGYPRTPVTSIHNNRCLTGGFVGNARRPNLEGFNRTASLNNNFNMWTDLVCDTPDSITLQLNGQATLFSCNPGGLSEVNINNTIQAMEMCDPLLYGFFPFSLEDTDTILSLCRFPNQMMIGRSSTYDDQFAGPNSSNPSGYSSHCELMAQSQIPSNFTSPAGTNERDPSLILAARLALENPQAFQQKRVRLNNQCRDIDSNAMPASHCRNLLHRLSEVERVSAELSALGGPTEGVDPNSEM